MKTNAFAAAFLGAATLIACNNSTSDPTLGETQTMETYKKGYQLYTIREEMVSDSAIEEALQATRKMGYVQVESFGYKGGSFFGQGPEKFKMTIDCASLSSPSGHYMPTQLAMNEVGTLDTSTIPDIINAAEALGQKWVVIPWMSEAWRNAEGYEHLINYLKALGTACKERGMVAAWHNHEFEFQPLENGTVPYDYLIKNLKGEGVVFEMDIHWLAFAGEDPVKWFEKYPGMFPLWHVKDFAPDTLNQVPVGQGVIDWKRVFANAELSGMKHYYIEQDVCSADRALDCLKESIDWAVEQPFMK
ncbi:MAG TPA: xylose isomerase [Cryomorphaceae bacterium]|nr:xylose isomerase [Cryomorphaceae bacterium]|tara:strand:- start:128 stop:1036 length:909 start_codon:yes stop_codon:yes gene_type:complete